MTSSENGYIETSRAEWESFPQIDPGTGHNGQVLIRGAAPMRITPNTFCYLSSFSLSSIQNHSQPFTSMKLSSRERALAPEVWDIIGSFVSNTNGLNSLCRSSKYLLNTIRPRLYRKVVLDKIYGSHPSMPSDDSQYSTLALIASRPNVAAVIREFYYRESGPMMQEILLRALQSMAYLQSLDLSMPLYGMPEIQAKFFRILGTREHPIPTLRFDFWREHGRSEIGGDLILPKLQGLRIRDHYLLDFQGKPLNQLLIMS